jgi:uncharacterized protein
MSSPEDLNTDIPFATPASSGPPPFPSPLPPVAAMWYRPTFPEPPRIWTVFVAFVCVLGAQFIAGIVWTVVWTVVSGQLGQQFDPNGFQQLLTQPAFLLPMMALAVSCTGCAALAVAWRKWKDRLHLYRPRVSVLVMMLMVLGTLAISHAMGFGISLLPRGKHGALYALAQMLHTATPWQLTAAVVIIGFGAGIGEELFFRGYCQSRLTQRWGAVGSILMTSLLFGVLHMDVLHSTFAFFIGLYVGWVALRAGSIYPAIACHVANNVLAVVEGALIDPNQEYDAERRAWTGAMALLMLVVCAVVTVLAELLIWRRLRSRGENALHKSA